MTFSTLVLSVSLSILLLLLLYTLWLLRSGLLSPHVTVRWVLVEGFAMLSILLWGRLAFIRVTSALNDRELLVILAVIFFALFSFLVIESMVLISSNRNQLRRVTQELALLKSKQQGMPEIILHESPPQPDVTKGDSKTSHLYRDFFLVAWMLACVLAYHYRNSFPESIQALLTANYKQ
ncbi:MAG: hypothetical protein HQK55_00205 [Deltaproteobacteria bacterium]|nr:hypothetical protein [Deltaproteobacteria bacterium]